MNTNVYTFTFFEDGYYVLKLKQDALTANNCRLFQAEMENFSNNNHIFVDCADVSQFPNDWLRAIVQTNAKLKLNKKGIKLFSVNMALTKDLKALGVYDSFSVVKTLKDALSEIGIKTKKKVDTNFLEPFIQSTIQVLKIQAQIDCSPGKLTLRNNSSNFLGDVSGVIGIVSENFNGSFIITFPEKTYLNIISNMLGEKFDKLEKELVDGASELLNIIFGQAKVELNNKGYAIKMAIPSVICGKNHSHVASISGDSIIIPFSSNGGEFFIEICLTEHSV